MSLLILPTTQNATGEVKKIFDEMQEIFGMVPNGVRQWSANPQALQAQWEGIKNIMSKSQEEQKLHTMIRYLVSEESSCTYCIGFNAAMLINMFEVSQDELQQLQQNPSTASLNDKNKALLLLAMQSIKSPDSVSIEDIQTLKALGVTEIEMFDIVHEAAKMLVANTLFTTFKVQRD